MRNVLRLLPFLFLFALACPAWATQIIIQDPVTAPFTVSPITTSQFLVTFTDDCGSALSSSSAGSGAAGCFAFKNLTGSEWTSITLSTSDAPADGGYTCASPGLFSTDTCGVGPGDYVLTFTNGAIPDQTNQTALSYYVISESDLPPGDLTFDAVVTFATTPEPSGLILLGTGLLCAGTMMWVRRRRIA